MINFTETVNKTLKNNEKQQINCFKTFKYLVKIALIDFLVDRLVFEFVRSTEASSCSLSPLIGSDRFLP